MCSGQGLFFYKDYPLVRERGIDSMATTLHMRTLTAVVFALGLVSTTTTKMDEENTSGR